MDNKNIIEQFNNYIASAPDYIRAGLSDADTVKIAVSGNTLTFTVVGVGSTSLILY